MAHCAACWPATPAQWRIEGFSKLGKDKLFSDRFEVGISEWWVPCGRAASCSHVVLGSLLTATSLNWVCSTGG